MAELRFSMEPHGASVVASVQGELDITSSQRFDDFLTEAAATSDQVILDLSDVDFMDTTALAVIVGHWRRQVEAGGLLFLAGALPLRQGAVDHRPRRPAADARHR